VINTAHTGIASGPALSPPADVLELITPWLHAGPDRVALIDRNGAVSYGELAARSAAVAAHLRERGLGPGDAVVVHARLSAWAVIAMMGALRAGVRYVPVDASFPSGRRELMHARGGARLALTGPGVEPLRADPTHSTVDDSEVVPGLAYTCFTSGSSGVPKRVDIPVPALAFSTAARLAYYPQPVHRFLLCSSISFDSAVAGIYWTLATGGGLVIPSDHPTDLVAVARAAREHSASHLLMIPSLYRRLVDSPLADRLATLTTVVVAGESCPPGLVRGHLARLPRARLYNEYGPTECTVWSTVHACTPADADAAIVPIGRPIPGARVSVHAPDGRHAAIGELGELRIGGPGVALAGGDGTYHTGDLVRWRDDGLLEFHGRDDDQIKLGGARIEVGEIEHLLRDQDGVLAAAVGVADRHAATPVLGAFVVLASSDVDERMLRSRLLAALPAAAVPALFTFVERLPAQPNGKVDRRALDRLTAERAAGPPPPERS
jgi:non-ribosomal peptide synthetase component F